MDGGRDLRYIRILVIFYLLVLYSSRQCDSSSSLFSVQNTVACNSSHALYGKPKCLIQVLDSILGYRSQQGNYCST